MLVIVNPITVYISKATEKYRTVFMPNGIFKLAILITCTYGVAHVFLIYSEIRSEMHPESSQLSLDELVGPGVLPSFIDVLMQYVWLSYIDMQNSYG